MELWWSFKSLLITFMSAGDSRQISGWTECVLLRGLRSHKCSIVAPWVPWLVFIDCDRTTLPLKPLCKDLIRLMHKGFPLQSSYFCFPTYDLTPVCKRYNRRGIPWGPPLLMLLKDVSPPEDNLKNEWGFKHSGWQPFFGWLVDVWYVDNLWPNARLQLCLHQACKISRSDKI